MIRRIPTMRLQLTAIALVLLVSSSVSAFLSGGYSQNVDLVGYNSGVASRGFRMRSSSDDDSMCSEIFVLSYDGCIADTVNWRIQTGLQVAASVWPNVVNEQALQDTTWLENKLAALSHVLCHYKTGISTTCEYALAARLLLEEQELDQGRSNGKGGKYASKFHPQQQATSRSGSTTGSRPLTVGEIAANWKDGGMIRETLQVKYHCNYKDPIPILQEKVEEMVEAGTAAQPVPVDSMKELLGSCRGKLIVTVTDASDLLVAQESMKALSISFETVKDAEEVMALEEMTRVAIMVLNTTEQAQKVLQCAPSGSTTYMFESSWPLLEKRVSLYGDNIPRQGSIGKSFVPGRNLSLSLASWAENTDPTHQSAATMNTWTSVVDLVDFSELVSARITSR